MPSIAASVASAMSSRAADAGRKPTASAATTEASVAVRITHPDTVPVRATGSVPIMESLPTRISVPTAGPKG